MDGNPRGHRRRHPTIAWIGRLSGSGWLHLRVSLVALALFLVVPLAVALAATNGIDKPAIGIFGNKVVEFAPRAEGPLWIGVSGNKLVDRDGNPVRLLGVNRPGAEYQCVDGGEFFEGPTDEASIEAIRSWRVNVVRVPLNESCWLGINGVDPKLSGEAYQNAIHEFVSRLEQAGLYVILDLHWAAPGKHKATGLIPMADADHAPDFWRSLATSFRDDRAVLFDLYNEPHDISWACWRFGCDASDAWFGGYRAAGMQELVDAVRSTGAAQPLLIGGLNWASDPSGWLDYRPEDPLNALVASNHTYDFTLCDDSCRASLAKIAKRFPVVTGELGEGDCSHQYIDPYMRWADRRGISYLGWAWYAADDLTCFDGPTLIEDFSGKPTPFGIGLREHLRELYAAGRGIPRS